MKRMLAILLAIMLTLAMITPALATAAEEKKRVSVALAENLISIDPTYTANDPGYASGYMMYDCLVESDHSGSYKPALATSWEVDETGTSWTFHLRQGVVFQNGQPFTSADVVCVYQRILDDRECDVGVNHWELLESIEAIDEYTVVLKTREPFALTLDSVGWTWIFPHETYEQYGEEMFNQRMVVGSGPWKLKEWAEGQYILFERFEEYWNTEFDSYYDEVEFKFLQETASAISAHLSGDVQVNLNISYDMIGLYNNADARIQLVDNASKNNFAYWGFNCAEGRPFADKNLRLAFEYAIDRQLLVDALIEGNGAVCSGLSFPGMAGYDETLANYEYNPELAKEYLAKSHYDGSQITVSTKKDLPFSEDLNLAVSEMLNEVGFNTKSEICETATLGDMRATGNYDIFMVANMHMDNDSYAHINKRILNDAHHSSYVNEAMFDLIRKSNAELDPQMRDDLLKQFNALLRQEAGPNSVVLRYWMKVSVDKGVTGYECFPDGYTNMRNISFDPALAGA